MVITFEVPAQTTETLCNSRHVAGDDALWSAWLEGVRMRRFYIPEIWYIVRANINNIYIQDTDGGSYETNVSIYGWMRTFNVELNNFNFKTVISFFAENSKNG